MKHVAKKIFLWLIPLFYVPAGINHFVNPDFYIPLIPDYLPSKELLNTLSGLVEILFGTLFIFVKTRRLASVGLILMLIAFIPAHVYFIEIGSCVNEALCVPEWLSFVRLALIHPLLIGWLMVYINSKKHYFSL